MTTPLPLPPAIAILWVLLGILISLVLPLAVSTLRKAKPKLEAKSFAPVTSPTAGQRLAAAWKRIGGPRYVTIGLAAMVVAIVLVFLLGLEFTKPRDAALAGFAWESLLSKLMARPQD